MWHSVATPIGGCDLPKVEVRDEGVVTECHTYKSLSQISRARIKVSQTRPAVARGIIES